MASDRRPATLQRRLVVFGAAACRAAAATPKDLATAHVASQLIRSATSPAANYAEARSAQSRRGFAHRIRICLKELRETAVWLEFLEEFEPGSANRRQLARECSELTAIFVTSLRTVQGAGKPSGDQSGQ